VSILSNVHIVHPVHNVQQPQPLFSPKGGSNEKNSQRQIIKAAPQEKDE